MNKFLSTFLMIFLSQSFLCAQYIGGSGGGSALGASSAGWASAVSSLTTGKDSLAANGLDTTLVILHLKDIDGNALTVGGDNVVLATTAGTLSAVADSGNGTYTAVITAPSSAATASFSATVNGLAITQTAAVKFGTGIAPVQLVSFLGTVSDQSVRLNWKTATETNSSSFEIERKSGTGTWSSISVVAAHGTSAIAHEYSYVDKLENIGSTSLRYRLKAVDNDESSTYSAEIEVNAIPTSYSLGKNYPNPFNPTTTIRYSLPEQAHIQLVVYDILGRAVATLANEDATAGYYSKTFNGAQIASGVYFYRLIAQGSAKGSFSQIQRMLLVK